jgi:hypothetical protein
MIGFPQGLIAFARRLASTRSMQPLTEHLHRVWHAIRTWRTGIKSPPGRLESSTASLNPSLSTAPPLTFRCLEPRRVLSVNAVFAAGVLDIAIQDDGGNVHAALLSDDGTHFFVDADGDLTYDDGTTDPLELRGLLSDLTRVNVLGDGGIGTFLWRDNFATAALTGPGATVVDISQVFAANLSATANIDGSAVVSAEQSIQLGGLLSITEDLTASTTQPTGTISGIAGGELEVGGHTTLAAHNISLGNAAGDHLSLNSLTVQATGTVSISEDGSLSDTVSLITGANTASSFQFSNEGSITLAPLASITTDAGMELNATGTNADITIHGVLNSTSGNILIEATDQVSLGSAGSISTLADGTIGITANGTGITLADGSQINTVDGAMSLVALNADDGHISLSQLTTTGLDGNIQVLAAGNITDATAAESANISSPTGSLLLRSLLGSIGTVADDIDIDVRNLVFDAGSATLGMVHISDVAGGLRVHGPSTAGAGATITANSPLTIAADINLGASSTFTAGNSAAAGDHLTIENSAVVTLNSVVAATLAFNAGDDILLQTGGRIVTTGNVNHTVILNADLDHLGVGAADGDRGSITQDGTAVVEVTTNLLIARAAEGIDLDTQVDQLDAFSSFSGPIAINEVDSIRLERVETTDGSITVVAGGTLTAVLVDSTTTDSDDNDVSLTTTAGDIVVHSVRAGLLQGDVLIHAQGSILDGDTGIDDVDVAANDVTLQAQTGSIGGPVNLFFRDLPSGLEVVTNSSLAFPLQPGNLLANAPLGSVVLNEVFVAGTTTVTAETLFLIQSGDLDFTLPTWIVNVDNLALIADSDNSGLGTLAIDSVFSVAGDLRLEGADIVAVGPGAPVLDLSATRLLFRSGGTAEMATAVQVLDASTFGDLTVTNSLPTIQLVDLNGDNVALQTTSLAGGIVLESFGTIRVSDDVLAGNDGLTTSTGSIEFRFAAGATGDILIHDTILSDHGNISLAAPGSIRIENPAAADPLDEAGADNLPLISTIIGNITLVADTDGNGGEIFMADGARIIAGRSAVNYVPGIDGSVSPSTIVLGTDIQGAGLAQIELTATDSITVGSLQSANNSSNAVRLTSLAAAILDGGDLDVDIVANNPGAQTTLTAFSGIGSTNAIETAAFQIAASNLGPTGNIALQEVAVGQTLISLSTINLAAGGSVLIQVADGSLAVAGSGISAIDGNITLTASNDLLVSAAVNTTGAGDIYLSASNAITDAVLPNVDGIHINASITAEAGSILAQSQFDLRTTALISSNTGAIGLTATRDIAQLNTVSSAGDILVDAGRELAMDATAAIAGANIILSAGTSIGLSQVSGTRVAMAAGGNIHDNNAASLNVSALTLHISAGGNIGQSDIANGSPDANVNAIEVAVGTMAASGNSAIYLHQLVGGGNLNIGSLSDLNAAVVVDRVLVDGSNSTLTATQTIDGQNGLRNAEFGPIKVRVEAGALTIDAGSEVTAGNLGDILLWASGDVIVGGSVASAGGHITLWAGDDLLINNSVSTNGAGSLYGFAGNAVIADALPPNVDGINVQGSLNTEAGSILLDSAMDLRITAQVTSSSAVIDADLVIGNIGLLAQGQISQSADISTLGDVLVTSEPVLRCLPAARSTQQAMC